MLRVPISVKVSDFFCQNNIIIIFVLFSDKKKNNHCCHDSYTFAVAVSSSNLSGFRFLK